MFAAGRSRYCARQCRRCEIELEAVQNKKTQEETSMMSKEQLEAVEERQLRRRAKWMLKNFRKFLEQKHKQEEEMRNTPLFTRDDALYVLSGMAAHKGGERVQTSNISNAPETAAMNVDETLERMNREVRADVAKGYDQLCERITVLNCALMQMDPDVRSTVTQVFCDGVNRNQVVASDGHYFSRKKVFEFIKNAENVVMEVLIYCQYYQHTARQQEVVNE